MRAQHTQGTWAWTGLFVELDGEVVAIPRLVKYGPIIAAAPEMLAALEFIVSQAREPANTSHTLGSWSHGAGMEMARAAIAKAEGGAP